MAQEEQGEAEVVAMVSRLVIEGHFEAPGAAHQVAVATVAVAMVAGEMEAETAAGAAAKAGKAAAMVAEGG